MTKSSSTSFDNFNVFLLYEDTFTTYLTNAVAYGELVCDPFSTNFDIYTDEECSGTNEFHTRKKLSLIFEIKSVTCFYKLN